MSNVCLGIKNIFELWESSWEESIFQNYTHNGDITSLEYSFGLVTSKRMSISYFASVA